MILLKFFDVRQDEIVRTLLMFFYIFLIIASILILKPIRNSLFLIHFGAKQLPYAFILVALFAGIVAFIYAKFSSKIRLNYLIANTLMLSVILLFVFWGLLRIGYQAPWFIYSFYIWAAIFGVICAAQFWLLATYVFNTREAKRLFGFIGAGGISGGIVGGYLTKFLAPVIRTENLILICILFLLICIWLLRIIWKKEARIKYQQTDKHYGNTQYKQSHSPIKIIFNSKHLTYLAALIGVGVIVANLVDYQFSAIASENINSEDQLTAFLGFWLSNLSIASLLIQLLLTGRILKNWGVGMSLLFLPVGILIGAIAILFNPAIWSAVLIKVSDGSFKQSINKSGIELLSLPFPSHIKIKTKAFIDVFVDNIATGLSGIILILFTVVLNLTVSHISIVIISLLVLWGYFIVRVRSEYINSFRLAIEKRSIDISDQAIGVNDATVVKSLLKTLGTSNKRQISYILGLLEQSESNELIPYLHQFINHPSNSIKSQVLDIAVNYPALDFRDYAQSLLEEGNEKAKYHALKYLCTKSDDKLDLLYRFLNHSDYGIKGTAMICAAEETKSNKDFGSALEINELIDRTLDETETTDNAKQKLFLQIAFVRVIGIVAQPKLFPYLHLFLENDNQEVKSEAIKSAGMTRSEEFIPALISKLELKPHRRFAREALSYYGENIIDKLSEYLGNPDQEVRITQAIPKILSLIGSQKSITALIDNLNHNNLEVRYEIIRALNNLRRKFQVLNFNKKAITKSIIKESKYYYGINQILKKQIFKQNQIIDGQSAEYRAIGLLLKALKEKRDDTLERIFRMLGLRYESKDMYNSYLGITGDNTNIRANSIELLDNILEPDLKRAIIPIIDDLIRPTVDRQGNHQDPLQSSDCYDFLFNNNDDWLKTCALFSIGESNRSTCLNKVEEMIDSNNPIIRETAELCLNKIRVSD